MKRILDFDDPGASDDELAKGVTVGDIRAWHDCLEKTREVASKPLKEHIAENMRLTIAYDDICTAWAKEREAYAKLDAAFERHLNPPLKPNPAMKRTS